MSLALLGSTIVTSAKLSLFADACKRNGVTVPEPVTQGLATFERMRSISEPSAPRILGLSDGKLLDYITQLSIREHMGHNGSTRGLTSGLRVAEDQLLSEIQTATVPLLDGLVEELRPRFDEVVAPLVEGAQKYGFSMRTTSDHVVDMADEEASATWRASRHAWAEVKQLASFRRSISTTFHLSPTPDEQEHTGPKDILNHSVSFAAGDNWGYEGSYYVNRDPRDGMDWFSLALGGLRLNTPSEVRAKITARYGTIE